MRVGGLAVKKRQPRNPFVPRKAGKQHVQSRRDSAVGVRRTIGGRRLRPCGVVPGGKRHAGVLHYGQRHDGGGVQVRVSHRRRFVRVDGVCYRTRLVQRR
jgi:hypothetical protein